jgi:Ca2+/Na+ antiporter
MTSGLIQFIMLIVVIVLSLILYIFALIKARKEGFTRRWIAILVLALGLLFITYLAYNTSKIEPAGWAQILLMLVLVSVTGFYAWSASRQADANVKMAEEMKEQRIMASRPLIIQRAVLETESRFRTHDSSDWFSHFEVYNAGNGPAIEVEISLLNKEKTLIHSRRKSFLRAGETPIEFSPTDLASLEKSTFYLVAEYQSVFSHGSQPTWYQTWLPFETVEGGKQGKIYVKAGELEFKEVSENDRLDAFSSRSKPK